MPAAVTISDGMPKGPLNQVTDNTKVIKKELRKWNDKHPIFVDDPDDLPPSLQDDSSGCSIVPSGATYMLALLGGVFAFRRPLRRRRRRPSAA